MTDHYLADLAARRRFGMRPGLEAITALAAALGNPERKFKSIHLAGTNGKGAVSALMDAALRAGGLKIGRYTSPHLVRLNERFFLNGEPVADERLERYAALVEAQAWEITFFEALTAVAFLLYADSPIDYAILECGLGGRLDATNICAPALTVITRIGLDHCDWLGSTVETIAAEKAGIIKSAVPVVLGRNAESVQRVVASIAAQRGALYYYAPDLVAEAEVPSVLALKGNFNRENAQTALAALRVLGQVSEAVRAVAPSVLHQGFAQVVWPGRFQQIGRFLVDGAHNPPAAAALASALDPKIQYALIAGFCGDKEVDTVLKTLAPHVRAAFAVATNNPRSLSAAATAAKMSAAGMSATAMDSLAAALAASTGPTLICGSLFLAGEALVALDAYPWGKVRFDPAERLCPSPAQ